MGGSDSSEKLDYLVTPPVFHIFRKFKDPNSSSFIRFQCILYDSAVLFSAFLKLIKLKKGDLISQGEPILQNSWIIWSALLYFNFRSLKDPNSFSFMRFSCFLHDSVVLFQAFRNFLKLKRGDLISLGATNSAKRLNYLVPPPVFQF